MTPTRTLLVLTLVASSLLVACSGGTAEDSPAPPSETTAQPVPTDTDAPSGDRSPLEGTWQVTAMSNGPVPPDVKVTMEFKGNRVSGSAGCNMYGADVTSTDTGQMTFGPVVSTAMACEAPAAEVEETFLSDLKKVQGYGGADSTTSVVLEDKRGVGLLFLLEP